jgi:hypothetical protein
MAIFLNDLQLQFMPTKIPMTFFIKLAKMILKFTKDPE